MTLKKPLYLQDGAYSATDDQRVAAVLLSQFTAVSSATNTGLSTSTNAIPAGGVVAPFDRMRVTASASSSSVSISPGACVIPTGSTTAPGVYVCAVHDASETVSVTSNAANGNPRRDLIYAAVRTTADPDSVDAFCILVEQGTPTSIPVTPSAPSTYDFGTGSEAIVTLALASVYLAANAAYPDPAETVDLRQFTAALGGVHVYSSTATAPEATHGKLAWEIAEPSLRVYDAVQSSWKALYYGRSGNHDTQAADASTSAIHHTLGSGSTQAAAGSHSHGYGTGYQITDLRVAGVLQANSTIATGISGSMAAPAVRVGGVTSSTGVYASSNQPYWSIAGTGYRILHSQLFASGRESVSTSSWTDAGSYRYKDVTITHNLNSSSVPFLALVENDGEERVYCIVRSRGTNTAVVRLFNNEDAVPSGNTYINWLAFPSGL